MKESPILYNGPMVRAILDDKKLMTRRPIKPQPRRDLVFDPESSTWEDTFGHRWKCPYGTIGDHLWVRETWQKEDGCLFYAADNYAQVGKWRPSIFMPRFASRIILEITNVRVERVQEITEGDARKEGITDGGCLNCGEHEPCGCNNPRPDARDVFIWLWDSIYKDEYSWIYNPFVWVIEFKRM